MIDSFLAETVKVPQMAESISEGTLKSWLKQPGDTVQADEEVATIETDKVRCRLYPFLLTYLTTRPLPSTLHRLTSPSTLPPLAASPSSLQARRTR